MSAVKLNRKYEQNTTHRAWRSVRVWRGSATANDGVEWANRGIRAMIMPSSKLRIEAQVDAHIFYGPRLKYDVWLQSMSPDLPRVLKGLEKTCGDAGLHPWSGDQSTLIWSVWKTRCAGRSDLIGQSHEHMSVVSVGTRTTVRPLPIPIKLLGIAGSSC
jgi:hypothetical protein